MAVRGGACRSRTDRCAGRCAGDPAPAGGRRRAGGRCCGRHQRGRRHWRCRPQMQPGILLFSLLLQASRSSRHASRLFCCVRVHARMLRRCGRLLPFLCAACTATVFAPLCWRPKSRTALQAQSECQHRLSQWCTHRPQEHQFGAALGAACALSSFKLPSARHCSSLLVMGLVSAAAAEENSSSGRSLAFKLRADSKIVAAAIVGSGWVPRAK
jgi:hypothetical protein